MAGNEIEVDVIPTADETVHFDDNIARGEQQQLDYPPDEFTDFLLLLFFCLLHWLTDWLTGWLVGWMVESLSNRLIDWLMIDWLIDWLINWLINCYITC